MSDNTLMALLICTAIASCTTCASVDKYVASHERIQMTPEQMCVQRAWTQAERVECLKAREEANPEGEPGRNEG